MNGKVISFPSFGLVFPSPPSLAFGSLVVTSPGNFTFSSCSRNYFEAPLNDERAAPVYILASFHPVLDFFFVFYFIHPWETPVLFGLLIAPLPPPRPSLHSRGARDDALVHNGEGEGAQDGRGAGMCVLGRLGWCLEGNGVFCFGSQAVYENTLLAAVTVAVAWRLVGISRLVGPDS